MAFRDSLVLRAARDYKAPQACLENLDCQGSENRDTQDQREIRAWEASRAPLGQREREVQ